MIDLGRNAHAQEEAIEYGVAIINSKVEQQVHAVKGQNTSQVFMFDQSKLTK